ncbi:MAG: Rieske (2Fe-2S) protein [Blastocatellia bacterium]
MEFHPVCKFSEVGFGEAKGFVVEGHSIAIFNIRGKLYAIENMCPHMAAPLDDGVIDGQKITCRLHFWQIDVTNGQCVSPDNGRCVSTYPVKTERGVIKVGIEPKPEIPLVDE